VGAPRAIARAHALVTQTTAPDDEQVRSITVLLLDASGSGARAKRVLADAYSSSSLDAGRPVVDHAGRAKVGAAGVNVRDDERVSRVLEGHCAVTRGLELLAGDVLVARVPR
jgi:hypothetical protein